MRENKERQEDPLRRKSWRIKHSWVSKLCRRGWKAGITIPTLGWKPQVSDAKCLNLLKVPSKELQPIQQSHVCTWLQIPNCSIKLCSFDLSHRNSRLQQMEEFLSCQCQSTFPARAGDWELFGHECIQKSNTGGKATCSLTLILTKPE